MCANSDIADPSIRLHMRQQLGLIFAAAPAQLAASGRRALGAIQGMIVRQQLVLPVVSYGCEVWGAQHQHFTERAYFNTSPGEDVHLGLLRWYTSAGPKAHRRVILEAANQLPVLQRWPQWSLQLRNKLATANLDCWLAHQAFVKSMQMWQAGNSRCWAARLVSHLHHLGILPAATPQLWTKTFEPAVAEANMNAITAHKGQLLGHYTPYRDL
jgi:hypothetical protein